MDEKLRVKNDLKKRIDREIYKLEISSQFRMFKWYAKIYNKELRVGDELIVKRENMYINRGDVPEIGDGLVLYLKTKEESSLYPVLILDAKGNLKSDSFEKDSTFYEWYQRLIWNKE
jgi:hypothetical protein